MESKTTELMTIDTVPNVEVAKKQWAAYQELCRGLLDDSDIQKIKVKDKDENGQPIFVEREFKKKSAWQKLARAFNVNTEIIDKEFQRSKTGRINEVYYCIKASLPNGRSVESDALCSRSEKGKKNVSDHTIMATAKTRATSRAISELIGAGEVSSDEMSAEYNIADDPDHHYISHTATVEEKPKDDEVFVTANVVSDPDPDDLLRSQAMSIKDMLEQEGTAVTKHSMKLKVVKLVKSGDLPADSKHALLQYITKHCPEELEE